MEPGRRLAEAARSALAKLNEAGLLYLNVVADDSSSVLAVGGEKRGRARSTAVKTGANTTSSLTPASHRWPAPSPAPIAPT